MFIEAMDLSRTLMSKPAREPHAARRYGVCGASS